MLCDRRHNGKHVWGTPIIHLLHQAPWVEISTHWRHGLSGGIHGLTTELWKHATPGTVKTYSKGFVVSSVQAFVKYSFFSFSISISGFATWGRAGLDVVCALGAAYPQWSLTKTQKQCSMHFAVHPLSDFPFDQMLLKERFEETSHHQASTTPNCH